MYTSLIDQTIIESDALYRVTRRAAGTRDAPGRFTPGAAIVALVRCDPQARGEDLDRQLDGDSSAAAIDIYVTLEQLAAAYLEGDGTETPLGWTSFNLAPTKGVAGPPGDRIEFDDRVYEIVREETYDEAGPLIAPSRRYVATTPNTSGGGA